MPSICLKQHLCQEKVSFFNKEIVLISDATKASFFWKGRLSTCALYVCVKWQRFMRVNSSDPYLDTHSFSVSATCIPDSQWKKLFIIYSQPSISRSLHPWIHPTENCSWLNPGIRNLLIQKAN